MTPTNTNTNKNIPQRTVKSFTNRGRHLTDNRKQAWESLWAQYGLEVTEKINLDKIFSRAAPIIIEIGFGMGDSLLAMAAKYPETNFIGIEVHTPGIGALFAKLQQNPIKNLRILAEDAVTVLENAIPDNSIDKIFLFFPDPWPKVRHHKRRLVQISFAKLVLSKLKPHGQFHIATDSKDYALHSLKIIEQIPEFFNAAREKKFSPRPNYRILTKFENRGIKLGHKIWDLIFEKM